MKRRDFLLSGSVMLIAARPAAANTFVDALVDELREEGYRQFEISSTFLGRTRIRASSATRRREIVLNPRTGEILRDYWVNLDNSDSGSGSVESTDDFEDEEPEDEEEEEREEEDEEDSPDEPEQESDDSPDDGL